MLEPFTLLFDDEAKDEFALPKNLHAVYGGDWLLPRVNGRPYTYANFALSRDGRVSFNVSGHLGGGDVSGFNAHDRWLMGLLRARADAVVVGDNTLRLEPDHLWTCEYIFQRRRELLRVCARRKAANPSLCKFSCHLPATSTPKPRSFASLT